MKSSISLLIFFLALFSAKATAPDWSVNSSAYSQDMSMVGVVLLDGVEVYGTEFKLAVFVGGECRGVAEPAYVSALDRYFFLLQVRSNGGPEALTFKLYDAQMDAIVELTNQESFVADAIKGSYSQPYVFTNQALETEFLDFSFVEVNSAVTIGDSTISVVVDETTDLTSLTAVYNVSEGSKVYMNGVLQESGQTVNDYTDTVYFEVVASDGSSQQWAIVVSKDNKPLSIASAIETKEIQRVYDVLGNEVSRETKGQVLIVEYVDGSREKVYVAE